MGGEVALNPRGQRLENQKRGRQRNVKILRYQHSLDVPGSELYIPSNISYVI